MGAYNGRLMPRLIFGVPLQAVILSGITFTLLVIMLLPSAKLDLLRPLFFAISCLIMMRVYRIMKTAAEFAIMPAMDKNKRLHNARRIID